MKNFLSDLRSHEDFQEITTSFEQWQFLLRQAILAPSLYNTQPWLFRLRFTFLDLYADRGRSVPIADPLGRYLIMSCGCVLFHLQCIMRHYHCLGPIDPFPVDHPDFVARVHLGYMSEAGSDWASLFNAIPKRRTCRVAFSDAPFSFLLLAELETDAEAEGTWLSIIADDEKKLEIARLVREADNQQWLNPEYPCELAKWIHTKHGCRKDGIPDYALPDDELFSFPDPSVQRVIGDEDTEASVYREIATASTVIGILGTENDTQIDWLKAGRALDRMLLRAAARNVYASFLNQPIASPESRERLRELSGYPGHPQSVFRLGTCALGKATPRLPIEEMLVQNF